MLDFACMFPLRNFQPEEAATAASSLKSNCIKSEKNRAKKNGHYANSLSVVNGWDIVVIRSLE